MGRGSEQLEALAKKMGIIYESPEIVLDGLGTFL